VVSDVVLTTIMSPAYLSDVIVAPDRAIDQAFKRSEPRIPERSARRDRFLDSMVPPVIRGRLDITVKNHEIAR